MPQPDYLRTLNGDALKFISEAVDCLNFYREPEQVERLKKFELDDIPVKWCDEIIGYLVISEIDGRYDFALRKDF